MAHTHAPIKTISDIKPGDHLCCIYSTEDEHRTVITQYLRAGLEQNEKVFYIVDARTKDVVINYLKNDGLDVENYLKTGQFAILTIADAYMKGGVFDPDKMIVLLTSETNKALDEGYSALRVTGEMSWALRGLPGSERLIEYENKLNTFFPGSKCLAICQYDRRSFDAEILLNILLTHPFAFIGENLFDNFYYAPPEEILQPNKSEMTLDRWIANIKDRKAAEQALRESEERFRLTFELASIGKSLTAIDGKLIKVNRAFCEILGYTAQELQEKGFAEVTYPDDVAKSQESVRTLLTGEHPMYRFEKRYIRKDGAIVWADVSTMLLRDTAGKPLTFVTHIMDITERKKAEDTLRKVHEQLIKSEDKFQSLYMNMIDGAALHELTYNDQGVPEDYVIIEINPEFEKQLGISRDTVIGKTSREAYGVAEPPYLEIYARVALTGEPKIFETYFPPLAKHFSISAFCPHKGSFATVFEDITERKRAEEALQQANKQLNLLSSITRHDILNQLLALKGYIEISRDYLDDKKTLGDFLEKEEKIARIIEEQITFTKDYQNLGVSASAWQNVNASIRNAMAALPLRAVHVEADPADPDVYADPLFEKVFYNLIDNALRYGSDQMKTIRVSSQESDMSLTIVCEDDGVGISAEDKKKLFRKGFGKHTGLGLFLSREILAITGITIIENGEPGKGARFEITVPKGAYRFGRSEGL